MLLTREEILGANDLAYRDVPVSEWKEGAFVRVKAISGSERDEYEGFVAGDRKSGKLNTRNMRARLLVLALIDEDGKRLFTINDLESLGRKNAAVIDRLYDVATELAGISKSEEEAIEENFHVGQNGHSTLSLP